MKEYILETSNFKLSTKIENFSKDYNDTIMHVSVTSKSPNGISSFSCYADMEIDRNEFVNFLNDLKNLYDNLTGIAIIKECFKEQYIEFSCDKRGHIIVKGYLCSDDELAQNLNFSNSLEQSYLKDFVKELLN